MKVGDYIIIKASYEVWDGDESCEKEKKTKKNLKNEIGKILTIVPNSYDDLKKMYEVEIMNCPYKDNCEVLKTFECCCDLYSYEMKSLNSLKLKKLIKHGV